jgi:hypothetical protein
LDQPDEGAEEFRPGSVLNLQSACHKVITTLLQSEITPLLVVLVKKIYINIKIRTVATHVATEKSQTTSGLPVQPILSSLCGPNFKHFS